MKDDINRCQMNCEWGMAYQNEKKNLRANGQRLGIEIGKY